MCRIRRSRSRRRRRGRNNGLAEKKNFFPR